MKLAYKHFSPVSFCQVYVLPRPMFVLISEEIMLSSTFYVLGTCLSSVTALHYMASCSQYPSLLFVVM